MNSRFQFLLADATAPKWPYRATDGCVVRNTILHQKNTFTVVHKFPPQSFELNRRYAPFSHQRTFPSVSYP